MPPGWPTDIGDGKVPPMSLRPDIVECWIFRTTRDGRPEVLLIRRSPGRIFPGLWQCVTGRLDAGERIPVAALREVEEETKLSPPAIEAFYDLDQVSSFYSEDADGIVTSMIFAVRVGPSSEPTLSEEHDAYRWEEPEEALRLAVWPSYDESIRRIRTHLLDPELAPWFEMSFDGRRLRR
jgi:8-oxo-dGTP pyrophosphatase MutT (NUDIX family)